MASARVSRSSACKASTEEGMRQMLMAGRLPLATNRSPPMTDFVFPPIATPSVEVMGTRERFPVRRIFCVGRNYAEHVREMGVATAGAGPVFFTKPADAIVPNGASIRY